MVARVNGSGGGACQELFGVTNDDETARVRMLRSFFFNDDQENKSHDGRVSGRARRKEIWRLGTIGGRKEWKKKERQTLETRLL